MPAETETIYSSRSRLRRPGTLANEMWKDLVASRELAWRLFIRDIRGEFRSSFLGAFWAIVPPALTAAGLTLANRSGVLNVGETDIPYPAYIMLGTVLWQTFLEAFNSPERALKTSKAVLGKIKFPYESIILAQVGQILFHLTTKLILVILLFLIFRVSVSWMVLLSPLAVAAMVILGVALGLLLVPIINLVQDISRSMQVIQLVWFFLTPVVYPPPEQSWMRLLVRLNPVTPPLLTARDWITTGQTNQPIAFTTITLLSIGLLLIGWVVFRLSMPYLIERVIS
ncbi:MAG: ABC transporter permease [Cyanobacteria bacterium J06648_16]